MNNKECFSLAARYIFLLILAFFGFPLIYLIFRPLTTYPVLYILDIFYKNVTLFPGTITLFVNGSYITLVDACISGAAYYLLIFLNITLPLKKNVRVKSLAFLIFSFLILNIARIVIFTILFNASPAIFDVTHKLFWYLGSTILVVILWFVCVFLFKIKSIPIYTDIKNLLKYASRHKRKR